MDCQEYGHVSSAKCQNSKMFYFQKCAIYPSYLQEKKNNSSIETINVKNIPCYIVFYHR